MRMLKGILRTLSALLIAAVLCFAVSTYAVHEDGEEIVSFLNLRITVTGAGAAVSFLVFLLFSFLWLAETPSQPENGTHRQKRLNAAGFGFFPAAAVWKIFEQHIWLSRGKSIFEPLPEIPYLTSEGFFAPSRIEFVLSLLCFAVLVAWLATRKADFPWNGDLLLTVVCTWGMLRVLTEEFRLYPLMAAGRVNIMQILMMAAADICLLVWTLRSDESMQKSTAFAVLEWIVVLSCETVIILNSAGVLTAGSMIGDLAVNTGCVILCLLLMLFSGKDSREAAEVISGSDSPAYYS